MTASAMEARNLCKVYGPGSRALNEVSFAVPQGSITLLAGPSGSGKTTLLVLLGGLDRPTKGAVLFAGQDLSFYSDAGLARIRRRIGIIAQGFALIPALPVWENITYPLIPQGVRRAERRRRAQELLDRLGLGTRMAGKPRHLSGGEQQRIAVARSLVCRPEILLADEPTSNLDEAAGRIVVSLFTEAQAAGTTVVVSSHDASVRNVATGVIELDKGELKNALFTCQSPRSNPKQGSTDEKHVRDQAPLD